MFDGGNPFESDTTVRLATSPQVRVAAIDENKVTLVVECIAADGHPALTFQRADLRVGDCLALNNLTLDITIKEKP